VQGLQATVLNEDYAEVLMARRKKELFLGLFVIDRSFFRL